MDTASKLLIKEYNESVKSIYSSTISVDLTYEVDTGPSSLLRAFDPPFSNPPNERNQNKSTPRKKRPSFRANLGFICKVSLAILFIMLVQIVNWVTSIQTIRLYFENGSSYCASTLLAFKLLYVVVATALGLNRMRRQPEVYKTLWRGCCAVKALTVFFHCIGLAQVPLSVDLAATRLKMRFGKEVGREEKLILDQKTKHCVSMSLVQTFLESAPQLLFQTVFLFMKETYGTDQQCFPSVDALIKREMDKEKKKNLWHIQSNGHVSCRPEWCKCSGPGHKGEIQCAWNLDWVIVLSAAWSLATFSINVIRFGPVAWIDEVAQLQEAQLQEAQLQEHNEIESQQVQKTKDDDPEWETTQETTQEKKDNNLEDNNSADNNSGDKNSEDNNSEDNISGDNNLEDNNSEDNISEDNNSEDNNPEDGVEWKTTQKTKDNQENGHSATKTKDNHRDETEKRKSEKQKTSPINPKLACDKSCSSCVQFAVYFLGFCSGLTGSLGFLIIVITWSFMAAKESLILIILIFLQISQPNWLAFMWSQFLRRDLIHAGRIAHHRGVWWRYFLTLAPFTYCVATAPLAIMIFFQDTYDTRPFVNFNVSTTETTSGRTIDCRFALINTWYEENWRNALSVIYPDCREDASLKDLDSSVENDKKRFKLELGNELISSAGTVLHCAIRIAAIIFGVAFNLLQMWVLRDESQFSKRVMIWPVISMVLGVSNEALIMYNQNDEGARETLTLLVAAGVYFVVVFIFILTPLFLLCRKCAACCCRPCCGD